MGFQFRKLLSDSSNVTEIFCSPFCESDDKEYYCPQPLCFDYCYSNCYDRLSSCISPPTHHQKPIKFLIAGVVLASVFLLVCFYAFYVKFYSGSRRRRRRTEEEEEEEQRNETHQQFLDEDHGPVLDHPIWYINTIGLQPSVINSIAVCKYKRGDGLVEGTDCSVCLSEFEEDETLRLLPKCSHAFHVPCIDTWLRSHTNCPLCRAPIVANSAGATSSEGNSESVSTGEESQIRNSGNSGESEREMEGDYGELGIETEEEEEEEAEELHDPNRRKRAEELNGEEEGFQPMRRSVSLDSLSAFNISQALANVHQTQSDRNSRTELVKQSESNMGIQKRVSGNQSLLKFMASSSIGRSLQIGPSSLKRSISCGAKLFMSRYSKNSSSVLPL